MEEDIKNSILIIALDTLINTYEIALEESNNYSKEQIEYAQFMIESCKTLIEELSKDIPSIPHKIGRPKWKTE